MEWMRQIIQTASKPLIWWFVIACWERAIRVRCGKKVCSLGPGIHFRIPFLDRIYVQSVRLRTLRCHGLTATTDDGKTVTLSFAVEFAIGDVARLYDKLASPDVTVLTRIESTIARHVTERRSDDLVQQELSELAQETIDTVDWSDLGLTSVTCYVTSYAIVRPIRLMQTDYYDGGGLDNLDDKSSSGER